MTCETKLRLLILTLSPFSPFGPISPSCPRSPWRAQRDRNQHKENSPSHTSWCSEFTVNIKCCVFSLDSLICGIVPTLLFLLSHRLHQLHRGDPSHPDRQRDRYRQMLHLHGPYCDLICLWLLLFIIFICSESSPVLQEVLEVLEVLHHPESYIHNH